jgi:hypothetical protein
LLESILKFDEKLIEKIFFSSAISVVLCYSRTVAAKEFEISYAISVILKGYSCLFHINAKWIMK